MENFFTKPNVFQFLCYSSMDGILNGVHMGKNVGVAKYENSQNVNLY